MEKLLEIKELFVEFHTLENNVNALNGVNLSVNRAEAVGLVGETGAGKTTTALSILGLLPKPITKIPKGSIYFDGVNILDPSNSVKLEKIRGDRIAMIFQNPLTALNPVFTIGEQVAMVFRRHRGMDKKTANEEAKKMLEIVGIPGYRVVDYPHQFSGGMRQRVGIAAALACDPSLLIADEPTTALDVTIQAQVLELMKKLQENSNTSLIMITHNLGIVNELCNKVAVMYAGAIIEYGEVREVFKHAAHPYTQGLIGSLPDIKTKKERLTPIPGFMSDPTNLPPGCKFAARCPHCKELCKLKNPDSTEVSTGHFVACHFADDAVKRGI